jgi:hypothetical protein
VENLTRLMPSGRRGQVGDKSDDDENYLQTIRKFASRSPILPVSTPTVPPPWAIAKAFLKNRKI